ncbi:MAG: hypothetical protein FJ290_07610 [Planctomycetes bacterium]|nr:hypothetical protein [Planctomycetota bacterium]
MRAVVAGLLCLGILCATGVLWAGEAAPAKAEEPPAKAAPDVEGLKKQAAELLDKDKALRTKLEEMRTKALASPDVAKLREAEAAAEKAYDEKRKADPAYAAALKAQAEAQAAYYKTVQDKVAASDDAKAIAAELAAIGDKAADFTFQEALARLELDHPSSPINVALDKDADLAKLRAAAFQAPDKEARDKARKAYDDARKARKEAMPEAKKVMERIEAAKKGRADLRTAEAEATKKLAAVRRKTEESDDANLKAAREKSAAAYKAAAEAMNSDALKAVRKARDDAHAAVSAKVKEVLAANPDAAALTKERDELRTRMAELDKQLRQASKK